MALLSRTSILANARSFLVPQSDQFVVQDDGVDRRPSQKKGNRSR